MGNQTKKKSRRLTNALLLVIFLVGVGLLSYPALSDYWNSFHQSRAIVSYTEKVANLDNEKYQQIIDSAIE